MNELFKKGNFQKINNKFMLEGKVALDELSKVQEKFKKSDIDNFLNELHDSIVGFYLGFKLVNVEKHGFDCKYSEDKDVFLESKVASLSANTWNATFNDTNLDKCEAFRSNQVWIALSLWKNASELLCICYGQNPKIGEYLAGRVANFKNGNSVRSTQSISFQKLIRDYGFRVLTISTEPQELISILSLKSKSISKSLTLDIIDTYKNFKGLYSNR